MKTKEAVAILKEIRAAANDSLTEEALNVAINTLERKIPTLVVCLAMIPFLSFTAATVCLAITGHYVCAAIGVLFVLLTIPRFG